MKIQYAHSNHGLFSEDYLDEVLPGRPIWTQLEEEAKDAFKQIQKIYSDNRDILNKKLDEDGTEQAFIEKVLDVINPHYLRRPKKSGGSGKRWIPDYALFDNETKRIEARRRRQEGSNMFKDSLGILEAKRWERPLDRKLKRQRDSFEADTDNPALQIVDYLFHARTQWGILTNGRLWRIYECDQSYDLEKWYEVDLIEILDPTSQRSIEFRDDLKRVSQLDAFKYFYLFFRKEAFPRFLQEVLDETEEYELGVSENLKENVYKALRILADGFVQSNPDNFDRHNDKDLIRQKCFVLLYRLLFILFAESKPYKAQERLLPRGKKRYDEDYSLWALRHKIAEKAGEEAEATDFSHFDIIGCEFLERLKKLFRLIDNGSEHFKIPKEEFFVPDYNGGLFDPKHFDEDWKITDRYLAEVIDLLSRSVKKKGDKFLHFINYSDLKVDKLGGIYEGLLENLLEVAEIDKVPAIKDGKELWVPVEEARKLKKVKWREKVKKGEYYPVTDRGERKSSGSYYTPSILVDYIVEQTLKPLIDRCDKEIEPKQKELEELLEQRKAQKGMEGEVVKIEKQLGDLLSAKILDLRILDPAMGSGHFLVSATKYLAKRLTEFSTGEEVGEEDNDYRIAKRRVVENCIFGVDKNELAVELTKVSLWIETVARDHALSFLDHHLRWGDSLLGTTIDSLQKLRHEKKTPTGTTAALFSAPLMPFIKSAIELYTTIERTPSRTAHEVKHKEDLLKEARDLIRPFREVADIWMADWFTDIDREDYESAHVNLQIKDKEKRDKEFEKLRGKDWFEEVQRHYEKHRFFHWELEFPESYFDEKGKRLDDPGFDAVIGNPPWERIRLEEVQFFTGRSSKIALATRAADRKEMIKMLEEENPELWQEYLEAKDDADRVLQYLHRSEFYPLMGRGDTNFYAVFAERASTLIKPTGRVGVLTPSGIATDNTTQYFFQELVDNKRLEVLRDFENKKEFFPDIDTRFKFSIILFGGRASSIEKIRMAFFLHSNEFEKLIAGETDRSVELQPEDFALFNPNTRTCPVFRTQRDYELTKKIYRSAPVFIDKSGDEEVNPWGISFKTMFHMTNDSHLFKSSDELERDKFYLVERNIYKKGNVKYLPLYEGKMVQMYDHRAANVEINPENIHRPAQEKPTTLKQHINQNYTPNPQFWVNEKDLDNFFDSGKPSWLLVFKNITSPTNVRSFICSPIPLCGVGNSMTLTMFAPERMLSSPALVANLASFVFDFAARQKIGGQNLNFFVVNQFPVLPPEKYDEEFHGKKLIDIISPKVLELCYTAHDLAGFAKDMGYVDKKGNVLEPFKWDSERRFHLRCQLDALYFILYGLDTGEAREILKTFPVVKREDEKRYGRYRTRDLIIAYMNAYAAGDLDVWVEG